MQYMLLIHDDEGTWGAMSEEENARETVEVATPAVRATS